MKGFSSRFCALALVALTLPACSELRARSRAREGNRLYLEGNYENAAREYRSAQELLPSLPVITFNLGLACRQLMIPGAKTPESERSTQCALDSFQRLQKLRPQDARGEQLYVQTLFDADRFDTLAAMYESQLKAKPNNLAAINGLVQVYSRWDRWSEALRYTIQRAEVASNDAEAHYAVGVFIWSRLFQKGGSGERASFDPRPEAKQVPPPFAEGDIVGDERIRLADQGIAYLEKALAIRPKYREAMIYLNLLFRQKSYAFFDRPDDWTKAVEAATGWQKKALELDNGHSGQNGERH